MSNHYMKRSLVLVTLFLSVIATASPAIADCDRPRSALTALKQSDVVFRGTVREVKTAGEPTWTYAPFPRAVPVWHAWIVTLDVSRVWKGMAGKRFVLHIVQKQIEDAFIQFEPDSEYLVFALRNSRQNTALFHVVEPTYGAAGCGGTTFLLRFDPYLVELGPGKSPE